MGGTCSSEDAKCTCPLGTIQSGKCASSCWKPAPEEHEFEVKICDVSKLRYCEKIKKPIE